MDTDPHQILTEYVDEISSNGIGQHGKKWHAKRVFTIGGSSLATIMGINPWSTIKKLITDKIGLTSFMGDIKPQWGNLFEPIIQTVVEHDKNCKIIGENIFIEGPTNTSYSPDGLAVIDGKIVLMEFKCPYSRLPNGKMPKYYEPQVKMGLDIIKIADSGLYAEGVFRRCTWAELDSGPIANDFPPRPKGSETIAFSFIGFYHDPARYQRELKKNSEIGTEILESHKTNLWKFYEDQYGSVGSPTNDYMCNDIGESPIELFTRIMDAYDRKILVPWYGADIVYAGNGESDMNKGLSAFIDHCSYNKFPAFGILPWKLFKLQYTVVTKEEGYLAPWLPKIAEIIGLVRQCNSAPSHAAKMEIYEAYNQSLYEQSFSDSRW